MGKTRTITNMDTFNILRSDMTLSFKDRIPKATKDNMLDIANILIEMPTELNEFTGVLISKIGKTIFQNLEYSNPLKRFKKGSMPVGKTIEEIWVDLVTAKEFDKEGINPMARVKPSVKVDYHTVNRKDCYEYTISEEQVIEAFTNENGIMNLTTAIIESVYNSAEYDEYLVMRQLIGSLEGGVKSKIEVAEPVTETACKEFIKQVRKASSNINFMNQDYNKQGVANRTPKARQVLFLKNGYDAEIDVEVLAKAFNLGKTDIETDVIVVDSWGEDSETGELITPSCIAKLVDERAIMVYDQKFKSEGIRNPKGLFTTNYLHIWQLLSMSKFMNVVEFNKKA